MESKNPHMANERAILQALAELPPAAVSQVEDFVSFLKERHAAKPFPRSQRQLAKQQAAAIKKWAGSDLAPGFAGRDHDAILYGKPS